MVADAHFQQLSHSHMHIPLSQAWFLKMLNNAKGHHEDAHPDAHAVRLRIGAMCLDCNSKPPFDLGAEYSFYLQKLSHVSAECRLNLEDEADLLQVSKTGGGSAVVIVQH